MATAKLPELNIAEYCIPAAAQSAAAKCFYHYTGLPNYLEIINLHSEVWAPQLICWKWTQTDELSIRHISQSYVGDQKHFTGSVSCCWSPDWVHKIKPSKMSCPSPSLHLMSQPEACLIGWGSNPPAACNQGHLGVGGLRDPPTEAHIHSYVYTYKVQCIFNLNPLATGYSSAVRITSRCA